MASAQLAASPGLPSPGGPSGIAAPPPGPPGPGAGEAGAGAPPVSPPRPGTSGSGAGGAGASSRHSSRRHSSGHKDSKKKKKDKKARRKLQKQFDNLEVRLLSQVSSLLGQFQAPAPPPSPGDEQVVEGEASGQQGPLPMPPSPAAPPQGASPLQLLPPGDRSPATLGHSAPGVQGQEEVLHLDPSPSDSESEDFYPLDSPSVMRDGLPQDQSQPPLLPFPYQDDQGEGGSPPPPLSRGRQ